MSRPGDEPEDEDWDAEEEDDMDLDEDDEDLDDDEEGLEDDIEDRRARGPAKSHSRKVAARRLIEQAREQRELHRSLAEFDDYLT